MRSAQTTYARYFTAGQLREQFGIERDGAILSYGNFALDLAMMTTGLLLAARGRGANALTRGSREHRAWPRSYTVNLH